MKTATVLFAAALAAAFVSASAFAADQQTATPNPQQDRMKSCNADAKTKGLKGDERKTFMSSCLKGDSTAAAAPANAQQAKMKSCNADAKTKGLKGEERKTFMSSCLKGTCRARRLVHTGNGLRSANPC